MMTFRSHFIVLATSMISIGSSAVAQVFLPFPQGLGFEVGTGHNQLLWHVNSYQGLYPESDYPREEFRPTPTVRIRYELYPLSSLQILPFIGYDQFGGKSKTKSAGYKDEFWIHALEMGLAFSYATGDLRAGVGFKYNRHFNVRHHFFGTLGQETPRSWEDEEDALFLKRNSANFGPRVSWVFSPWNVSVEGWFGITKLQRSKLDQFVIIRENHYRFLVAYTL
jgi:hypothetical protein